MAQKIHMIVSVDDDLDGTDGATEVRKFSVGKHKDRLLDLTEANAERFDRDMERWTSQRVKRRLAVGRKVHDLLLTVEEAARFDADMDPWLRAAKRHDRASQSSGGGQDRPADVKAATAKPGPRTDPPEKATADADPVQAGPAELVPAVGAEWWLGNGPLHKRANAIVRRWARSHGWPTLGDRGRIPAEAYDKWVARVWSNVDEPRTLDAAEAASRSRRTRKTATTAE